MQDLASLGFSVDSSQVSTASSNLDQLRGSTEHATRAHRDFQLQQVQNAAAAEAMRGATAALTKEVTGSSTALDLLMQKLDQARALFRATGEAGKDFDTVRLQVDALGQSFGVTSSGLEAYYRQTQQLQFTTPQTVQSLQRITEALANQTAQGQQVRRVLQDYGVSLAGLGINDADKALQRFTERMRVFQDSAQKFRSAAIVLGPMDADSYARLDMPDYVPITDRKRIATQNQYSAEIADRTRNASIMNREVDRNQTELEDLRGTYSLGGYGPGSIGLTGAQRESLRGKIGLQSGDAHGSESEQLTMLRYLKNNPSSPEGMAALDARAWMEKNGGADTGINRWGKYLNSGLYTANETEIVGQQLIDRQNRGTFYALGNRISSDARNLFGYYKGQAPIADARQQDPLEKYLNDQTAATTLAERGDPSLLRRQQAQAALRAFQLDPKTNKPLEGVSTEAYDQYRGVYGADEGDARYRGFGARLERQRDTAMKPGQGEMDAAREQSWLLSLPPEQRGQAEEYLRFAKTQPNVDVGRMMEQRPNFSLMMSREGLDMPGGMSPGQQQAFQQINDANVGNRMGASSEAFRTNLDQMKEQTALASQGSGVLEELTAKQQAYNKAIADKATPGEIDLAQLRALVELNERRNAQAETELGNMAEQNRLEAARVTALQEAGPDPVARAQASSTSALQAEYETKKRQGFTGSYEDFMAQRTASVGIKAVDKGNNLEAQAQQELKTQRDLLSVAGSRADVQAKFASDQKVELEFAQSLGEARSVGNKEVEASLLRQIERAKDLRTQLAAVNQEAKNFQIGRDLQDGADYDNATAGIADPQARRRARLRRQNVMDNRATTPSPMDSFDDGVEHGSGSAPGISGRSSVASGGSGGLFGAIHYLESRGRTSAGIYGDGGEAAGPMQVHPGALADVNEKLGTNYTHTDLAANPRLGIMVGQTYAGMLRAQFGRDDYALGAYNAGPGKMQAAISSGRGVAGLPASTQQYVAEGMAQMANTPGMQRRDDGTFNADDASARTGLADSRDQFAARERLASASRGMAPGDQARARAGYVDPTGNLIAGQGQAELAQAGVLSSQKDANAATVESARVEIEQQRRLVAAKSESLSAEVKARIEAKLDNEERERGVGIVDRQLRGQQLYAQETGALAGTIVDSARKSRDATEDNTKLAAAWQLGAREAAEMQRALETAPLERQIEAYKKAGIAVDDLVAKLQKLKAEKAGENISGDNRTLSQSVGRSREQDALTEADMSLGVFASDRERERTRSQLQAQQYLDRSAPNADQGYKDAFLAEAQYQQGLKETARAQEDVRQGIQEIGSAALSTFNNAIVNGGKFRDVVGSLTKDVAGLLLKMAEKPLLNAGSDWLSTLLGAAKVGVGIAGGSAGIGISGGGNGGNITDLGTPGVGGLGASPLGGGYANAAGNAFVGGVRMFSAGGILDRPTHFFSAGGQSNVAGEVGDEAIMPLKRLPNGDMGVASGGGGRSITIHAPISINSQGSVTGSNGKMDPAVLDSMQKQLSDTMRAAIMQQLAEEKRPGGMLYN